MYTVALRNCSNLCKLPQNQWISVMMIIRMVNGVLGIRVSVRLVFFVITSSIIKAIMEIFGLHRAFELSGTVS